MKIFLQFAMLFSISLNSYAGNGVERGSVMIKGPFDYQEEIKNFLGKELMKCSASTSNESFLIKNVTLRKERVDNGITDSYYQINLAQLDKNEMTINELTVEVQDLDFHNWRRYEEKLSLEILNDLNQLCN